MMKKILAIALSLMLLIGSFAVTPVVSADSEVTIPSGVKQVTHSGETIYDYSDFDFSMFGENIFPDPTVSVFKKDDDGNWLDANGAVTTNLADRAYDWYYIPSNVSDSKNIANANAIFDKCTLWYNHSIGQTIYSGPNKNGFVIGDTSLSHTNDGSGVIHITKANAGFVPLPTLQSNKYYLLTFWVRQPGGAGWGEKIHLEHSHGAKDVADKKNVTWDEVGGNLRPGTWKRVSFVARVGTGADRTAARISIYSNDFYLDDFALYEITAEQYDRFSTDGRLSEPTIAYDYAQLSYDAQGTPFDYSRIDWSSFGTNLVPDPTVGNFVGDEYASYGTPVKDGGNYKLSNIDTNAWWDKHVEYYHGVVLWYQQKLDGVSNSCWRVLTSPKQRGIISKEGSLTNDGSGVMKTGTGDHAFPLPKFKKNKYYLIKFNFQSPESGFGWMNVNNTNTYLTSASNDNNTGIISSMYFTNKKSTVALVFYTGSNVYSDPNIWYYADKASYFDDFGMYEITKDEYDTFKTAGKITGHEVTDNVTVENDAVAVDKTYAEAGETVTVTVTPAEGKQLKAGSLKYIVAGKEYPITTRVGDESVSNVFTFTMPEEAVTVVADFVDKAEVNVALLGAGLNVVGGALGQDMRFGTRAYRKAGDKTLFLCGNYVLYANSELGQAITANGGVVSEVLAEQLVSPAEGQIVKRVPTGVLNDRCTEYVDFTLRIAGVGADAYKNTEYMCVAYTIYKDNETGELTTYYADACTRSYQGVVDALN